MKKGHLRIWISGILLLVTLIVAPYVVSHYMEIESIFTALRTIPPLNWLGVAAGVVFFYFLDFVRLYSLLRIFRVTITPLYGVKLTCISYLVSTLTPTSELHLPFMIFMFAKMGIAPGTAAAVSLTKSLYMVFWICVVSAISLYLNAEIRLPDMVADNLPVYLTPLFFLTAFMGLLSIFPEYFDRQTQKFEKRENLPRVFLLILKGIGSMANALSQIVRSKNKMHLLCHAGSLVFVFVYIFIGAVLADGLGIDLSIGQCITVFSNSLMVAYLSPVPGSIGITELATAYFLDNAQTETTMALSVLLRFFCWYMVLLPGLFLLFVELKTADWKKLFGWN